MANKPQKPYKPAKPVGPVQKKGYKPMKIC